MTGLVDLTCTSTRAPYVDPPLVVPPLRNAGRPKVVGNPLTTAHTTLIACRDAGNVALDLEPARAHLRHAGIHTVAPTVLFITHGAPDEGFLVAAQDRILPFVLFSDADIEETRAALLPLAPLFVAMAQAPWVLAPAYVHLRPWPANAIAPPWLSVRNDSLVLAERLHNTLGGAMLHFGLAHGTVMLVGGRFDARGVFVPPQLRHRHDGTDAQGEALDVPGFAPARLYPTQFPALCQGSYGAGVLSSFHHRDLPTTAHQKMAMVEAFLSCVDDRGTRFESGVLDNVVMDGIDFTAHERMSAVSAFRACIRPSTSMETP